MFLFISVDNYHFGKKHTAQVHQILIILAVYIITKIRFLIPISTITFLIKLKNPIANNYRVVIKYKCQKY